MPSPHLRALGAPALLTSPTDPTVAMDLGKPLALLTYLTLSGVEASRDHLVDLLWAHVTPERGRQSLRQALWQIRSRLGSESVSQLGDRLRVAVPLSSDVFDFLKAVTERRGADAVQLYTAPFFQSFAAPGALEFEQWADTMRTRLHSGFLRLGEEGVLQALGAGKAEAAIAIATRLRDSAPDRQAGWRLLIETLRTAGKGPAALIEAESLEAKLAQEHDPVEETTSRLLAELRRSPSGGAERSELPSPWEMPELVGREAQFATLLGAWSTAGRGRPRFAHVVAEPGLGKTRLLQELRRRLIASGASLVLVGARPEERDTPYSLAADLASALADLPGGRGVSKQSAASLVALDPRLASRYAEPADPSQAEEGERRRLLAIGDLIDAVAHERPTAILLDDLHWADPTSARVIGGALRRVSGGVLVVTTARPGRTGMTRDERATVLALDPLGTAAISTLLAAFGDFEQEGEGQEIVTKLHAASGGSPLRVLEALREATNLGALGLHDGKWTVEDRLGLQRTWEVMRDPAERLRRLSDEDRAVLLGLAVWARPVTIAELETITGKSRGTVEEGCRRLERGGLAGEQQGEWAPTHHTVSELVQVVAPPEMLAATHRQVARMRFPAADDPRSRREVVRHHWHGGDDDAIREVVSGWVRSARIAGDLRPVLTIIEEVCPPEVPERTRNAVLRGLPWRVRHPLPGWTPVAATLGIVALAGIAGFTWLAMPAALVVTVVPIIPQPSATPAPVVELRDGLGRLIRTNNGVVIARGVDGTLIAGDSTAQLTEGRAQFDALSVSPAPRRGGTIDFLLDGKVMGRITLRYFAHDEFYRLRWIGLVAAGREADPRRDTVEMKAGATTEFAAHFSYDAVCACSVALAMTPTWGRDRSRGWQVLRSVGTPRVNGEVAQTFRVTAPRTPGLYHLIFAIGPEPAGAYLVSATNWKVGTPSWNDGHDLADLTQDQIDLARAIGSVQLPWLKSDDISEVHGPGATLGTHLSTSDLGVATLTIQVR